MPTRSRVSLPGWPSPLRKCSILTAADLRVGGFYEGAEANVLRGWNATMSGDVVVMLKPGYLEYGRSGTSHSSLCLRHACALPHWPGVPKGMESMVRSNIRDIAPTLSALIGFPRPSGCTGMPMEALFIE